MFAFLWRVLGNRPFGFEVLAAAVLNSCVFWGIIHCRSKIRKAIPVTGRGGL
jgi:hypothetical protein